MNRDLSTVIHGLLLEVPELRGNLRKLETAVWKNELEDLHENPDSMQLKDFLYFYEKGTIHSVESIARIRRLVMQKYPYLRDKNYDERKKHAKDYIKEVSKTLFPAVVKQDPVSQVSIDDIDPEDDWRAY
jgi:hypothetical protein